MIASVTASFTCYGAIPDTKEKSKTELASVTMVKSDFSTDFLITAREEIDEIYLAPALAAIQNQNQKIDLPTSGIKRFAKEKKAKKPDKNGIYQVNKDVKINYRRV